MRILCLHGSGTSGTILSAQTSAFRASLDPNEYHFEFTDAPHLSVPGPVVAPFFEEPFFVWWKNPIREDVKFATNKLLERLRAEEVPFDVVLGFSQGCAILSSLILFHQAEFPGQRLPFRSAMFICGSVPLYVLDNWLPLPEQFRKISETGSRNLSELSAEAPKKVERMLETGDRQNLWDRPTLLWDGEDSAKGTSWGMPSDLDPKKVFGIDFSETPANMHIQIPTVHIYGHKDPICCSSIVLASLCDSNKRLVYDHSGGHEIPRTSRVNQDLATAVKWLGKQLS